MMMSKLLCAVVTLLKWALLIRVKTEDSANSQPNQAHQYLNTMKA
jgi:hypothetical protein